MESIRDEIIEELVSIVLTQDREIKKLQRKLNQIIQYLEVYEDYIKKDDRNGN